MVVYHHNHSGSHARAPIGGGGQSSAAVKRSYPRSKLTRWRRPPPSGTGLDGAATALVSIIMILCALNVMLRFPDLGALIAQYNQF